MSLIKVTYMVYIYLYLYFHIYYIYILIYVPTINSEIRNTTECYYMYLFCRWINYFLLKSLFKYLEIRGVNIMNTDFLRNLPLIFPSSNLFLSYIHSYNYIKYYIQLYKPNPLILLDLKHKKVPKCVY